MKYISAIAIGVLAVTSPAAAFSTSSSFSGSQMSVGVTNNVGMTMEYIPSGMSKEQWNKMKQTDKTKKNGKNLGASGITTFKSRSFSEWQKAGGKNLFPVDPKSVKSSKELPYMQRPGGSADDSDLSTKKSGLSLFGKKKTAPKKKAAPVAAAASESEKKNWWTF